MKEKNSESALTSKITKKKKPNGIEKEKPNGIEKKKPNGIEQNGTEENSTEKNLNKMTEYNE